MDNCILTNREVVFQHSTYCTYYNVTVGGRKVTVFICDGCKDRIEKAAIPPTHILMGLIADGAWPERTFIVDSKHNSINQPADSVIINIDEYFHSLNYPKDIAERMDFLLLSLFKMQTEDGKRMYLNLMEEKNWASNYFKNKEECFFYFKGLDEDNLIKLYDNGYGDRGVSYSITHKGLLKATEILKESKQDKSFPQKSDSDSCFIAMSFDPEVFKIRNIIKTIVSKNGYRPIIIDEENISSEQTIPEAIRNSIKNSKFLIADFTKQSRGVYFESAYAIGLGKPVINTCLKEDFNSSHFDVKQLQHILYDNEEDLKFKLDQKIKSWIKKK